MWKTINIILRIVKEKQGKIYIKYTLFFIYKIQNYFFILRVNFFHFAR